MFYYLLSILLFLTTHIYAQEITDNKDSYIKTHLETDIFPTNEADNTFKLVMEEDLLYRQITIPKDTTIICDKNTVSIFGDTAIIPATCSKIFLPDGRYFDIKGHIFSTTFSEGMLTKKDIPFSKDSKFLLKINRINDNSVRKDTIIKASVENGFSVTNQSGDTFSIVTDEYISDTFFRKILIPKGTKITCKQEEVKSSPKGFVVTASCNSMILQNGQSIDIKAIVHGKNGDDEFIINYSENAIKGTKLTIQLQENIDF